MGVASIYACETCHAERVWGISFVVSTERPMLNCDGCRKLTQHVFVAVRERNKPPVKRK